MKTLLLSALLLLSTNLSASTERLRCYVHDMKGRIAYVNEEGTTVAKNNYRGPYNPNYPHGEFDGDTLKIYQAVYIEMNGQLYRVDKDVLVGQIREDGKAVAQNGTVKLFINIETKEIHGYNRDGSEKIIGSIEEGEGCQLSEAWDLQKSTAAAFLMFAI